MFLGVPLVWEKIADKMRAIGASVTGVKKSISTWAKSKALIKGREAQLGGTGEIPWGTAVSSKILHKIKEALGLQCVKYGFTGAAPIRVDTLEYFASIGIQINEVYGMSECTGACTFSINQAHQWGSCGWEIPGIEVRVFKVDPTDLNKKTEVPKSPDLSATDEEYMGEICWRGRGNMMGYLAQADLGAAHVFGGFEWKVPSSCLSVVSVVISALFGFVTIVSLFQHYFWNTLSLLRHQGHLGP